MEQNKLKTLLQTGNRVAIAKLERDVSFDMVLKTPEMAFLAQKNNEPELMSTISQIAAKFVSVNFPDSNTDDVSFQFAVDVVEIRPDWNILDVVMFFKFIRQRQDIDEVKVWGNKITPMKLMSLMAVYEQHKSEAREQMHKKDAEKYISGIEKSEQKQIGDGIDYAAKFSEFAVKIVGKIKKIEGLKEKEENKAQDTKIFLRVMEQHWNEQIEQVRSGAITEQDAIVNHQKFRLEYKYKNNKR